MLLKIAFMLMPALLIAITACWQITYDLTPEEIAIVKGHSEVN